MHDIQRLDNELIAQGFELSVGWYEVNGLDRHCHAAAILAEIEVTPSRGLMAPDLARLHHLRLGFFSPPSL